MTRREKITKAKQLLTVEQVREQRVFIVKLEDGIKTCSDPGWPDEVMPHDKVFTIEILKSPTDQ